MQLGIVGLGRMGGNMRARLRKAGHEVIGFSRNLDAADVTSLADMVDRLSPPRVVWLMVPLEAVEPTIDELAGLLAEGDLVIDGGNSHYTDDGPRAARLAEHGIGYLDAG